MLIDSYNRKHNYLRISLTEKCNLRCTYCMPVEGVPLSPQNHLMSKDEIIEIASTFKSLGVDKIRLTGGEPLVRKDVGAIIKELSKLNIDLTLTTNGVLLDRHIDNLLEAGVRSINISLDTLDPAKFKTITRRNDFTKVLDNIDLSINKGLKVKLNVVLIKGFNENELIDFVALTKNKPVHVRFIEFMPFDGNKWSWEKTYPFKQALSDIAKTVDIEKLNDKPHATSKAYQAEGHQGTFGFITTVTQNFCSSCNRMRLTADGKMRNCLFAQGEVDLLTPLRQGKNIRSLIINEVLSKKEKLGGLDDFENYKPEKDTNRSMILIGG